jgi:hypothetical protein
MIRYNTQNAFWERTPNHDSAKAANRIGRLKNLNRFKKFTEEQGWQVRQSSKILKLAVTRCHEQIPDQSQWCYIERITKLRKKEGGREGSQDQLIIFTG